MSNLPRNLPELLRAAGLKVVEVDGWENRGRPASTGSFAPVGVLNHHTGSSAKKWDAARRLQYAKWMFLTGRPDLPAPLCQIALGPDGEVYVGAAGRSNHGGTSKASGSVAGGDGNSLYIGIEWMLSGTERIPRKMRKAAAKLNAVLLNVTGTSVQTVSCHYNTSTTGKWDIGDPNGVQFHDKKVLDIVKFREEVRKARRKLRKKDKPEILSVAMINVPFKIGWVKWQECFLKAAKSEIFGINECLTGSQRDAYREYSLRHGFQHAALRGSPNPVFWKRDEFKQVSAQIIELHPAGSGDLANRYPGFNAARSVTEVVLLHKKHGEIAVLNTHFVPNGRKVDNVWRDVVRHKSKKKLRQLAQRHKDMGRIVLPMGDMNIYAPFRLGKGVRWHRKFGIDKIGSSLKGSAKTFSAPTDHKHGVRAKLEL